MNYTVKRLKKDLVKNGFNYNKADDTFVRCKAFTGLSTKIYCYNSGVDVATGTLNASWYDDGFNINNKSFDKDVNIDTLLNFCFDS